MGSCLVSREPSLPVPPSGEPYSCEGSLRLLGTPPSPRSGLKFCLIRCCPAVGFNGGDACLVSWRATRDRAGGEDRSSPSSMGVSKARTVVKLAAAPTFE